MKFFSRIMMVVALLAVLAYGSFAFGKYVLSAKLFGDEPNSSSLRTVSRSTTEASAVTRQTGWKGTKPRVEVKVLPADEVGGGGNLPAFADEDGFSKQKNDDDENESPRASSRRTQRPEATPTPAARLGERQFDNASVEYSLNRNRDDDDGNRKRSTRRRRRTRERKSDTETRRSRSDNDSDSSSSPSRSTSSDDNDNGDSASTSVSSESSSSRERSDSNDDSPRESTRSRESTRTRSRDRERSRRDTSSSPVPRPEGLGSSGGDSADISPIPQPE